jgi:hypothetical protein
MRENGLEQGRQVVALHVQLRRGPAVEPRGVEEGRVELRVGGLEVEEELEHLVVDLGGPRRRAVHLVHHHHRHVAQLQRLPGHEAGLGHGSLHRVDQEEHAVDHAQDALHLAAEVGVPRGVDNVDLDPVPLHGGVLGQDGDPPLLLEGVRVHDPLLHLLVVAKDPGLAEHLVDQGGLAMVNVGDDGDVSNLHVNSGRGSASCQRPPELPP